MVKKIIYSLFIVCCSFILRGQNVGLGVSAPLTKLHISDNDPIDVSLTIDNLNANGYERLLFGSNILDDAGIVFYGTSNLIAPNRFRFFNNRSLGMYDWFLDGFPKMTLLNNGNLGIGSAIPDQKLVINGKIKFGNDDQPASVGVMRFNPTSHQFEGFDGSTWNAFNSGKWLTNGSSIYYNDGNVGISEMDPTEKLHIVGDIRLQEVSSPLLKFYLDDSYAAYTGVIDSIMYINHRQNGPISFRTNGNERLIIDGDGDVGIGTSMPQARLDVRGSAIFNEGGTHSDFRIESDNNVNMFFVNANRDQIGIGLNSPGSTLHIEGDSDDVLRVDDEREDTSPFIVKADGRVGIGIANPSYRLNVVFDPPTDNIAPIALFETNGSTNSAAALRVENTSGNYFSFGMASPVASNANGFAFSYNNNIGLSSDLMTLLPTGELGIGTTTPAYPLHVKTTNTERAGYFHVNSDTSYARAIFAKAEGTGANSYIGANGLALGNSTNYGVYGFANGGVENYGGYFETFASDTCYGVKAVADGSAVSYGVYGYASGGTEMNCGIYGSAVSGFNDFAGYFDEGDVIINEGNLGIKTHNPQAALHVTSGRGVLFEGDGYGPVPKEGAGKRFMWYPDKAAFRVGEVPGTEWDEVNIGQNSTALGYATIASGRYSTAMGYYTDASGKYSTAMGYYSEASGEASMAFGTHAKATGLNSIAIGDSAMASIWNTIAIGSHSESSGNPSIAMGFGANANGGYSTAIGHETEASGYEAIAMGNNTHAIGNNSFAIGTGSQAIGTKSIAMGTETQTRGDYAFTLGTETTAIGKYSTAIGYKTTAQAYMSLAIGRFNAGGGDSLSWVGSDPIFEIGNGTSLSDRRNAMTVYKNGATVFNDAGINANFRIESETDPNAFFIDASTNNIGIGTNVPDEKLKVIGNVSADDFYASNSNGVINCGGGMLSETINMISDNVVTPTSANGDEDLYIEDDLELGSEGYKPGGGNWAAVSDIRLKRDIQPFADGLDVLLQINPVRYKYNQKMPVYDHEKEYVGVIAQDILDIAPYMVQEKNFFSKVREDAYGREIVDDPGIPYYTYDGTALSYIIVNAIKEQDLMINNLQNFESSEQDAELEKLLIENKKLRQDLDELKMLVKQIIDD